MILTGVQAAVQPAPTEALETAGGEHMPLTYTAAVIPALTQLVEEFTPSSDPQSDSGGGKPQWME